MSNVASCSKSKCQLLTNLYIFQILDLVFNAFLQKNIKLAFLVCSLQRNWCNATNKMQCKKTTKTKHQLDVKVIELKICSLATKCLSMH